MRDFRQYFGEHLDHDAALFFMTFSRIEFALKRGGFVKGVEGRTAEPDWDKFARALGRDLYKELTEAPEAKNFRDQPPRRLVKKANEVEFVQSDDIKNLQMLFEAVRLVRNNLFHGEKPYIQDRDRDLIKASMFVLDRALNACDETEGCKQVSEAFMRGLVEGY